MQWKPETEALDFVSLTEYGNFAKSENIDSFLETDVGKAQFDSMMQEMKSQAEVWGEDGYSPTVEEARRILFSEQASQEFGGSEPEMTNEQMVDKMDEGFSFTEWAGDLVDQAGGFVGGLADFGVEQAVDGVTQNEGLLGGAADAISNREENIQAQLDGASPPKL